MSTFPRHGPREHAAAAASHFATISARARHVSLGTSSFFVLALLINLPWKFAASFSSNNGNNSPSSPPSQRRLTHSFTRSQFNLARAPATRLSRLLPSLPPSLSPSLAPIAVLALFTHDDVGGGGRGGRAAEPQNQLSSCFLCCLASSSGKSASAPRTRVAACTLTLRI